VWENVQEAGAHEDAAGETGKQGQNPGGPPALPVVPVLPFGYDMEHLKNVGIRYSRLNKDGNCI
jgi:hypothetical protein